MAPLSQLVVDIVGWSFMVVSVAITPIIAAAMIMRQLKWIGFNSFDKDAGE